MIVCILREWKQSHLLAQLSTYLVLFAQLSQTHTYVCISQEWESPQVDFLAMSNEEQTGGYTYGKQG